ncbi:PIN domain-containing protein [bacterium]|nr:MAG: PIN domain-containing protein [bacterium]
MNATDALIGVSRLLLDTNSVVSVLEREANAPLVWAVFHAALSQRVQLVVSPLTLIEILSKPGLSEAELRRRSEFCLGTQEIEFKPIIFDDAFAKRVAFHRRRASPQKVPDCIQYASAEWLDCDAILSNDRRFVLQSPVRAILTEDIDL